MMLVTSIESNSPKRRLSPPTTLSRVQSYPEHHKGRELLEQYISGIFHAAYNARILESLPILFGLERDGYYEAALGLRSASAEDLFCEQYLEQSVEQLVHYSYGVKADRAQIMELGNLVATEPGCSALLYIIVAAAMHEAGIKYLIFAANKRVRSSIQRCGFTPKVIQAADQSRLGAKGKNWGSYYEGEPVVMLADIELSIEQAAADSVMNKALVEYMHVIPDLADSIRIYMLRGLR